MKTKKGFTVCSCKYAIADVHSNGMSGYYCTNNCSKNFGKKATKECDQKEDFNPKPEMSFKDALNNLIMLPVGAYPDYFFLFGKEGETERPFYCVSFTDNKQMFEYREAMMRCFEELMKMKEADGDFAKGLW